MAEKSLQSSRASRFKRRLTILRKRHDECAAMYSKHLETPQHPKQSSQLRKSLVEDVHFKSQRHQHKNSR
ncbi:hypothetical protein ATANTOWER_010144 [Ataeniobius toweri]|uniref:Uncharacterized protein n=1 Tax=Ataeniobius toweri TaxID=208326 RepID=A0ABU7BCX6_9TELE|nr:hypothetical protein [Ataeniobius toweri]